MNKILIAALATSFALGVNEAHASEPATTDLVIEEKVEAPATDLVAGETNEETEIEALAKAIAMDDVVTAAAETNAADQNIIIYEIESNGPTKDDPDYVVIKNIGSEPVSLKDWYIWDDKDYTEFTKLGDITLAAGETYKLTQKVDFNFGLGGNDKVRLYNAAGTLIREEAWENHAEEVLRLNPATGVLEDTKAKAPEVEEPTEPPAEETPANPTPEAGEFESNIVINEVESNDDVEADYVELYNKGTEEVSLDGWYILDDKDDAEVTRLDGVSIKPGQYFVLENGTHFSFGLGKEDMVRLYNNEGKLVDKFEWSGHALGVYSRYPDGTGEFVDADPSKGAANTKGNDHTIEEATTSPLVINEVQQKGANDAADYVEIKNISDKDVILTGWYVLDDDLTRTPQPIGEGVVIPAGGYYILEEGVHFDFGLGKKDEVNLFNPDGKLADNFAWDGHAEGKVYARNEKTGEFSVANPTPGRANDSKTEAELADEKPVVINEVESSPVGGGKDYAEIYNRSNKDVDISGWYILDDKATVEKTAKIKEGTILKAGEYYAFEEGVDFTFGLGSNDEVNLYDKDGNLVDKFAWTSHATGTYGRYPDGFGDFVDGSPSKGRANVLADDPTADVERENWPGSQDITVVDETPIFDLKDLSGLDSHDGWIYGVNNKEGRFVIFKIEDGKVVFAPGFDEKGKAVNFAYDKDDLTKLGPDSEGITVDGEGRVYLAVERDNNNKNVNFNAILQVADPFKDEKVLVADRQWDITSLLPDVGANLGIETVEWVSMANLNGLLYDQKLNKALDANDYKDAYADGIFFVGMEANGHIYALVLKDNDKAELIADIPTGLGGVMSLDFDKTNNVLWSGADDGYNNIHTIIQFNGTNSPTIIHIEAPGKMDKKLNNEGFVIDSKVDANGNRATYWFMDGTNEGAFRKGSLKADYMADLGLTKIDGKAIKAPEKPVTPPTDDNKEEDQASTALKAAKNLYESLVNKLAQLEEAEKTAYNKQIKAAKTLEEVIRIHTEAKAKSESRVKVPSKPTNPPVVVPTPKPENPAVVVPTPSRPNYPVYVPTPVTPKPSTTQTTVATTTETVYVRAGYTYIKEGVYKRAELLEKRAKLLKVLEENRITTKAAKFLLEHTPATVAKIRPQLEALIKRAEMLQKQAAKAIAELDIILK